MLPADLLVTRTKKDRIYPVFAKLDAERLELAAEVGAVYKNFAGRKRSEIDEIFAEFEQEQGLNFKLVRGLRTLLERRCVFKSEFAVEPVLARRAVFEAASSASSGRVTSREAREEVVENVAARLGVSAADLERSLWSDLESEVVLADFTASSLTPEELLRSYNLSLAQTLLFKSTGMTLEFKSNFKEIFRAVKKNGLMYSLKGGGSGGKIKMRIEGASSLLKLSERYGTALAKLLPAVVRSDEWALDAEVVVRRGRTPQIYHFLLDSSRSKGLLTSRREEREPKKEQPVFDSRVEEKFYNEFLATPAAESWELVREPNAIFTGKGVFLPDFKFKHKEAEGVEVYFEIVGFWTADYLRKKFSKLRALPFNILVALNSNLACFNLLNFDLDLGHPTILYTRKVPLGEVLWHLAKIETEETRRQVESLSSVEICLEGGIIFIKDLATRYKVGKEAVRACLKAPGYSDFVVFKEVVVKRGLLNEVEGRLAGVRLYAEARRVIEGLGLPNPDEVLAELGFKVRWKGLDPNAATIELN